MAPLLLSACGFHLRGVVDFPPDVSTAYIQATDRYSPFYRELVVMLQQNSLGPVNDADSADVIIRVLSDETARRELTVSARNVPVEFEVYYVVSCSVVVHGEQIIDRQRFILTRAYTYNETKVLGKAREEAVLTNALAKDLVGQLVQTISAAN
jgi:LPS-assembly lipoprotein